MSKSIEELQALAALLAIEKQEDFEQFRKYILSLSLSKKREKGVCWQPLRLLRSGYTFGDRAYVTVERTQQLGEPHQFRAGMPVRFYADKAARHPLEKNGVIHFVDKNRMKIILNSKDLPTWLDEGPLGVDMLFDERSYLEMESALRQVMAAKGDRLAELREILLGQRPPTPTRVRHALDIPELNRAQAEAVNHILNSAELSIVHGPPGTGKTTTLVHAIRLICASERCVLVCAPSNTAVDLLAERLAALGLRVCRIGNISRVDESLISLTLDGQLSAHPESKHIKKLKVQAAELRRKAERIKDKRQPEQSDWQERRGLLQEARELGDWANTLEKRLIDEILSSAQAICCTLVNASHDLLKGMGFRTVVIDEAAQALEPATWIPIIQGSRVVLAGDPFQLPPTVKSLRAQKEGLGKTLIEKGIERLPEVKLLNVQYRMNAQIMGFSNQMFYEGRLLADASVLDWQLAGDEEPALLFIDTAGCGFEEKTPPESMSRYNPDEANILREHLYQLLPLLRHDAEAGPRDSLAIISPYKEQALYLKDWLAADEQVQPYWPIIEVDTIDGFQGQEADVVYISLVRSNAKGEIGFLADYRRMNVAMTRARKKLVLIGDSATIGTHAFYQQFIQYAEAQGCYRSAWEFMR